MRRLTQSQQTREQSPPSGGNGGGSTAPQPTTANSSDTESVEDWSEDHRDQQERDRHEEAGVAPHLAEAITARWFAADLGNDTAAAAVHREVSRRAPSWVLHVHVDTHTHTWGYYMIRYGCIHKKKHSKMVWFLRWQTLGGMLMARQQPRLWAIMYAPELRR